MIPKPSKIGCKSARPLLRGVDARVTYKLVPDIIIHCDWFQDSPFLGHTQRLPHPLSLLPWPWWLERIWPASTTPFTWPVATPPIPPSPAGTATTPPESTAAPTPTSGPPSPGAYGSHGLEVESIRSGYLSHQTHLILLHPFLSSPLSLLGILPHISVRCCPIRWRGPYMARVTSPTLASPPARPWGGAEKFSKEYIIFRRCRACFTAGSGFLYYVRPVFPLYSVHFSLQIRIELMGLS